MTDSKSIALVLSALAHPSRVDILSCLLAHHPSGLMATFLSAETGLAPSTLSHHLREMEKGHVIKRLVNGQRTLTHLDLRKLTEITNTLMQLCCSIEQIPQKGSQQ
ncbi:MAG: helix-turn-helix transcriptional regulator [Paracoccaceae bacterium]